jgi:hypothetical protein
MTFLALMLFVLSVKHSYLVDCSYFDNKTAFSSILTESNFLCKDRITGRTQRNHSFACEPLVDMKGASELVQID